MYYILSFLSGAALSLQVGVNGGLREKVGGVILSSLISFAVGTLVLAIVFAWSLADGTYALSKETFAGVKLWMFTGGILGAFYIFATIFASPKIGFANMFSLVICGQIVLALLFDHFGLFGHVNMINAYKIVGAVLLVSGVFIIQKS